MRQPLKPCASSGSEIPKLELLQWSLSLVGRPTSIHLVYVPCLEIYGWWSAVLGSLTATYRLLSSHVSGHRIDPIYHLIVYDLRSPVMWNGLSFRTAPSKTMIRTTSNKTESNSKPDLVKHRHIQEDDGCSFLRLQVARCTGGCGRFGSFVEASVAGARVLWSLSTDHKRVRTNLFQAIVLEISIFI